LASGGVTRGRRWRTSVWGPNLARARWVKVLAGRGNELTRDNFRSLWQDVSARLESIQILLPDPGITANSCLADREAELREWDPGYRVGLLAQQVGANIEYISAVASRRPNLELRLYNLPNICRIVLTTRSPTSPLTPLATMQATPRAPSIATRAPCTPLLHVFSRPHRPRQALSDQPDTRRHDIGPVGERAAFNHSSAIDVRSHT
jgi:hypothetical protein